MPAVNFSTREIEALQRLLRLAWQDLANPSLTPVERSEARNQMRRCHADLRRHFDADASRPHRGQSSR
ncbi:MAG: hypothetical protein ABWY14_12025 [Tardiphaga sp.]